MKIIIYFILGLISSITNILPLSYNNHLFLFQNLFNTKIFNYPVLNSLSTLPPLIATIIYIIKNYIKKLNKTNIKTIIYLLIYIIITLIINYTYQTHYNYSFKKISLSFFLTSTILIFIKHKSSNYPTKSITFKNILFLILLNVINLFINLPIFIVNLLGFYLCHFNQESSLKYSIIINPFYLFTNSIKGIKYLFITNDLTSILISISISTIISFLLINYLIKLITKKQLSSIIYYLLIIAAFTLIWFR